MTMVDTDLDEDPDPDNYGNGPRPTMTSMPPILPPEVAGALCKVMAGIKRLHRSDTNKFQDYKYTSADDFFEAVGPIMAEAGLLIIPQQVGYSIRQMVTAAKSGDRVRLVLMLHFDFYLAHSSGALWSMPLRRTINTEAGGPQTWGSAQTYAIKQFLRALLLIPTGDADADADEKFTQAVRPPPRQKIPVPGYDPTPPEARQASALDDGAENPPQGRTATATEQIPASVNAFLNALAKLESVDDVQVEFRRFRDSPFGRGLTKPQQDHIGKAVTQRLIQLETHK